MKTMPTLVSTAPAACRLRAVAASKQPRGRLNGAEILAGGSLIMLLARGPVTASDAWYGVC